MKHISMKSMMVLALGGMMVVSQTPAFAGFGDLVGGKKKGADSGGATVDKDAFGKSANELAGNVLGARLAFSQANDKLKEALGIKIDAAAKESEAKRAAEGSASDKLNYAEKLRVQSAEDKKQIESSMAQSKELSAVGKAKFAEGTVKFIEGVTLESAQIAAIQKLVEQGQSLVQSASPMEKAGVLSIVKPVTTMASIVPGDVKEGLSTVATILKFCQSQNISIPKDATDKLGGLTP